MTRANRSPRNVGRAPLRRHDRRAFGRRLVLEALEERQTPAVDLTLVGPGLSGAFLAGLQTQVDQTVFSKPAFLIGDQLKDAPSTQVLSTIGTQLAGLTISANTADAVKDALTARLGGLLVGGREGISNQPIAGSTDGATLFQLELKPAAAASTSFDLIVDPRTDATDGSKASFSILGTNVGTDSAPRMDNAGLLAATVDWRLDLTFGVDASGFFIQATTSTFALGLDATLKPNVSVHGKFGILPATFTNAAVPGQTPLGPTDFHGLYTVTMAGPSATDPIEASRLRPNEYGQLTVDGTLGGHDALGNASGPATADFSMTGQGSFLPSFIDPDQVGLGNFFNLDFASEIGYSVTYAAADTSSAAFGQGGDVAFTALRMDVSPFFTEFIEPIIVKIQQYLAPVKQIINTLEQPIPVIGDYLATIEHKGKPATVKTLLKGYMEATGHEKEATVFDTTTTLLAKILGFNSGGLSKDGLNRSVVDLGNFASKAELAYHDAEVRQRPGRPALEQFAENAAAAPSASSFMHDLSTSFSFPFLQDPQQAMRLILGDPNVTLFQFNAAFDASMELSKFIPIFYGLGIEVGGSIGVGVNVGVGFDSKYLSSTLAGLTLDSVQDVQKDLKALTGGIIKGFYFDDHNPIDPKYSDGRTYPDNTPGQDAGEAYLSFGIRVGPGVGIDLGVFQAVMAVTGGVTATINLDLNDLPENPDADPKDYYYDGRVRLDEFNKEVKYNPLSIFNASGNLTGSLNFSILVRAGIPPALVTLLDEHYTLFQATILDFNIYTWTDSDIIRGVGAKPKPPFARVDSGILTMMGDTDPTSNEDALQAFVLGHSADGIGYDVEVRKDYGRYVDKFTNVTSITGYGRGGNDQLGVYVADADATTGQPLSFDGDVTLHGNDGDDRLILRGNHGAGSTWALYGDDGRDFLSGGDGSDSLYGGAGDDYIEGNGGDDYIEGDDDDDVISGGDGNDRILGGGGSDHIDGGAGDDSLDGGAGDDVFNWEVDQGNDVINGGGGSTYDPITETGGDSVSIVGGQFLAAGAGVVNKDVLTGRDDTVTVGKSGGNARIASLTDVTIATLTGINSINSNLGAGADSIAVGDLSGTGMRMVRIDLQRPRSTSAAPANPGDSVAVNLSDGDDTFTVSADQVKSNNQKFSANGTKSEEVEQDIDRVKLALAGGVEMRIQNADPAKDRLRIAGNGGNDTLGIATGAGAVDPTALIGITLDGGAGDDTLTAAGAGSVALVGGPGNDTMTAPATAASVDGGSGTNTLVIDDSGRPASSAGGASYSLTSASLSTTYDATLVGHGAPTMYVMPVANVQALTLTLGPKAAAAGTIGNRVAVLGTTAGTTTLNLSAAGDTVQLGSAVGGSNGTLSGIAGDLVVNGGAGADSLVVDASGTATNLGVPNFPARMTAGSLSGLGNRGNSGTITLAGLERVDVRLGQGSDELTVTGLPAPTTTVEGGGGNDTLTAQITGEANALTASPFTGLGLDVEELDVTEKGSTAPTAWKLLNGVIEAGAPSASPQVLLDSLGAGKVVFQGAGADTLAVINNTTGPQSATIENGSIVVNQGNNVLSFAASLASDQLTQAVTVGGLGQSANFKGTGRVASVAAGDGQDLYVASDADNSVSVFHYSAATNTLRFVQEVTDGQAVAQGAVDGLAGASAVVASPDGRFIYVAGTMDNAIAVFSRDTTTGQLTFNSATRLADLTSPTALALSPGAPALYAVVSSAAGDGLPYAILPMARDTTTGALTNADGERPSLQRYLRLPAPAPAIAVSPNGLSLYALSASTKSSTSVDEIRFYSITPDDQVSLSIPDAYPISTLGSAGGYGIAVSPDGKSVYVTTSDGAAAPTGSGSLLTFARTPNGPLTASASFDGTFSKNSVAGIDGTAVSPDARDVYILSRTSHKLTLFRRDPATNDLVAIRGVDVLADAGAPTLRASALAISPDGKWVAVKADVSYNSGIFGVVALLYARDPDSGLLILQATNSPYGTYSSNLAFSADSRVLWLGVNDDSGNADLYAYPVTSALPWTPKANAPYKGNISTILTVPAAVGSAASLVYYYDSNAKLYIDQANFDPYGNLSSLSWVNNPGHSISIPSGVMAFSPDGKVLYTVDRVAYSTETRDTIYAWAVGADGMPIWRELSATPVASAGTVKSLAVSPDGKYLDVAVVDRLLTGGAVIDVLTRNADGSLVHDFATHQFNGEGKFQFGGVNSLLSVPGISTVYIAAPLYTNVAGSHGDNTLTVATQNADGSFTWVETIAAADPIDTTFLGVLAGAKGVTASPDGSRVFVERSDGKTAVFARRASDGAAAYLGLVSVSSGSLNPTGVAAVTVPGGTGLIEVGRPPNDAPTGFLTVQLVGTSGGRPTDTTVAQVADDTALAPLSLSDLRSPSVVTIASGTYAYALGPADNSLAVFQVTPTGMVLKQILKDNFGGADGLGSATSLAADERGVYIASRLTPKTGDHSIVHYAILADGTLALSDRSSLDSPAGAVSGMLVRLSPDGKFVYVETDSDHYPLAWAARDSQTGRLGALQFYATPGDPVDGYQGPLVYAADIAFSTPGKALPGGAVDGAYLFAVDAIGLSAWTMGADGSVSRLTALRGIDFGVSPSALALSPDGLDLYMAGRNGSVSVYRRTASSSTSGLDSLTPVGKMTDGVGGVTGLAGASDVAVSADGQFVIVSGAGASGLAVFGRDASTGMLTYVQSVRNGAGGVSGLVAPNGLTLAPNGDLYVASSGNAATKPSLARFGVASYPLNVATKGTASQSSTYFGDGDDNTPAGYASNAIDGNTNGNYFSGSVTHTLDQPNSYWEVALDGTYSLSSIVLFNRSDSSPLRLSNFRVTVYNGQVAVTSSDFFVGSGSVAAGGTLTDNLPDGTLGDRVRVQLLGQNNERNGILSLAEVEVFAAARPIRRNVGFTGMGSVTLQTGAGDDTVVLRGTTAAVTINTEAGADSVTVGTVSSTAPVKIDLGDDADTLNINSTGPGQMVKANGGRGDDSLNLWSDGSGSMVQLSGDAGDDTFRVLGKMLVSSPKLYGGTSSTDPFNSGDKLKFDAQGGQPSASTPYPTSGSISVVGYASVGYWNFTLEVSGARSPEKPFVAALNLSTSTIAEGTGVTLDATGSSIPPGLTPTYTWDVNGDGSFADVADTGSKQTLAWSDLVRLGIGDGYADAFRTISVKVTLPDGRSSVASATLNITNVAPTLTSVTSPAATTKALAGSPVTVTAAATDWAGALDPLTYDFDFNDDGTFEVSNGTGVASYSYPPVPGESTTLSKTVNVRVRDDDGGISPTQKLTLMIDNTPKVRAATGASTGLEGSAYTLSLVASGPKTDTLSRWTVTWGDGSTETVAGSTTTLRHVYADNGTYTIAATAEDADGAAPVSGPTVAIANVAPTLTVTPSASAINEGGTYTLGLASSDPGTDTITSWTINWGDGTVQTLPGRPTSASHVYAASRSTPYTVSVSATDEDGTYSGPSQRVTVKDVPPAVTLRGADSVNEGSVYDLAIDGLQNPGDDVVSALAIDWGDGQVDTFGSTSGAPLTPPATAYHTYADDAPSRTIRVSVTDNDGVHSDVGKRSVRSADGSVTLQPLVVAVKNVAPTIAPRGPASVDEGSTYTLHLPAAYDPGADTVSLYRIRWGDGTTTQVAMPGDVKHVYYGGNVTRAVSVDLVDEDGTWLGAGSTSAVVNDVPPTIALSGASHVAEGSPYALTLGAVTDPGGSIAPVVTGYRVSWGDGAVDTYATAGKVTHTYAEGPFSQAIVVDLISNGTVYLGAGRLSVVVDNVAPTFTFDSTARTVERLATLGLGSITISDPGVADGHSVTVDWGDGTTSTVGRAAGSSLTAALPTHAYATIGTYQASVTVRDDDGGSSSQAFRVTVNPAASDALRVTQVLVNGGAAQRSNVEQIAVRFNHATNIPALIASGQIGQAVSVVGTVNLKGAALSLPSDRFRWDAATFTLTIDLTTDGFGGSRMTMLADDVYEVRLDASRIARSDLAGVPLSDSDGTSDGIYRSQFHRLLGDFDGDRQVTAADRTLFLAAYGTKSSDAKYDFAFDLNGDGVINLADYTLMNARIGRRL